MIQIADDPIIRSMERTGYPPWLRSDWDDDEEDDYDEEDECDGENDY